MSHTFHIPVLGLGYSIDTPLKIARYGISSVISIVDDELIERMREFHSKQQNEHFIAIKKDEDDSRARRITAYLNLINKNVNAQLATLQNAPGISDDLIRYFDLLPDAALLKQTYLGMQEEKNPTLQIQKLEDIKSKLQKGAIDVNIMSKVDKANYSKSGNYLGDDATDALSALRGFAKSDLDAALVISAGLNPRLFNYMEQFDCFQADQNGLFCKRIILKVSDFRSAFIQAKVLAKKGLWVSEFRIESGLNCGGHAFATDGLLIGPILEAFKTGRKALYEELYLLYSAALHTKGACYIPPSPPQKITAQGGIGTSAEHEFLLSYYELDATGWGSPFLLVPEATNVDEQTLTALASASKSDFYLSKASPLGVLFNNFKNSTAELLRLERIKKGRPGSPCTKKLLCNNTEFTAKPICTASRAYQNLKLKELEQQELSEEVRQQQFENITGKVCLCEGLCASTYLKNKMLKPREHKAVSICPGPNLVYFSRTYSLKEMVDHIYGRQNLLTNKSRPNLFINELNLYIDYINADITHQLEEINTKKTQYYNKFKAQLIEGINYYKQLIPELSKHHGFSIAEMYSQLKKAEYSLQQIQ